MVLLKVLIYILCTFDTFVLFIHLGACSSLMEYYLRRVAADSSNQTSFEEAISRSYCISADMVHALHPNYPQKHESNHRPMLCQGVTIKTNSNQVIL